LSAVLETTITNNKIEVIFESTDKAPLAPIFLSPGRLEAISLILAWIYLSNRGKKNSSDRVDPVAKTVTN
jgi:hypothetical protein